MKDYKNGHLPCHIFEGGHKVKLVCPICLDLGDASQLLGTEEHGIVYLRCPHCGWNGDIHEYGVTMAMTVDDLKDDARYYQIEGASLKDILLKEPKHES